MRTTIYTLTALLIIGLAGVVVVNHARAQSSAVYETGVVNDVENWTDVRLDNEYSNPVVIVSGQGSADAGDAQEEARAVIRDVASSSFEVNNFDDSGSEVTEDIGYLVMEAGHYTIDGVEVEAGTYTTSGSKSTISWNQSFGSNSVVVADTLQEATDHAYTSRYDEGSIDSTGYGVYWESWDESNGSSLDGGGFEAGYIAIRTDQSSSAFEGGINTGCGADKGSGSWCDSTFTNSYARTPVLFTNPISQSGSDPTITGHRNLGTTSVQLRAVEGDTHDSEQGHATDDIPWIVWKQEDTQPLDGQMTSSSYTIVRDSLNSGGRDQVSSANYQVSDTVGEQATGRSTSSNYTVRAGYRQMAASNIAISSPSDVSLGSFGGVTGGSGEATPSWHVTTDNPAGYELSVKATTDPALQNTTAGGSFADYNAGTEPDYNFSVSASESAFGFSPEGANVIDSYLDNGSSCNTGSQNNTGTCWAGFRTANKTIARASDNNQPTGATTTLRLRAETGSDYNQTAGTYEATITVTAVAI